MEMELDTKRDASIRAVKDFHELNDEEMRQALHPKHFEVLNSS
jgi:hypothetical protein